LDLFQNPIFFDFNKIESSPSSILKSILKSSLTMSLTMMMFMPVLPVLLLSRTSAASSFASFNRKGHAFDTSSSIEKVKGGQNCVIVEERTALQHPLHHHGRRDHFDFRGGGAREGGHYDASGRGNIHVMQTNINGIERRGSSRNDG
jgi:hypothetical protein